MAWRDDDPGELQPEGLPPWLFRCGYREGWTCEPSDAEWYSQICEWLAEHDVTHRFRAETGRFTREWFRREHPRSDEVQFWPAERRLRPDPNPPLDPLADVSDPRRVLDPKVTPEERQRVSDHWHRAQQMDDLSWRVRRRSYDDN